MSELLYSLVSEFKGDYPDVPFAAGVDANQFDPAKDMFVTLPILKVGAKSRNGLMWTRAAVERIVHEINTKRVEGNLGHPRAEDRSTRYDLPALRWIGAVIADDGTAYAKAYIPEYANAVREYFRDAKRTNARVGTSVYGLRGKRGLEDMTLEELDIGHADRVSLPDAAAVPKITSEIRKGSDMGEELDQDKLIAELKDDRATLNLLVSEFKLDADKPLESAKTLVSEMTALRAKAGVLDSLISEFGLGENPVADAKVLVAELARHRARALVGDIDAIIAEMVKDNEPLRPFIREYLVGDDGRALVATKDDAKAKIEALLKKDHIVNLAKSLVSEMRGPNAFIQSRQKDGNAEVDVSPEAVARARASTGI